MPLSPGTMLGPYEIQAKAGIGGMGEVYKALDLRLDRKVAIKVLPPELAANPDLRQRLEREARCISKLSHPHICTLYDTGLQGDNYFFVMEYLEGETLAQRLQRGPLPVSQAVQCATEIADALHEAHRHGITHRDLKPGNIMLTKSGTKLMDFGVARLKPESVPATVTLTEMATDPKLTAAGMLVGTFQYMAPEQVEGKETDARTDIFALGTVIYEMVAGGPAFSGGTNARLIAAILSSEPPAVSSTQRMSPPALDHVVKTCLAKDPDERWQSAHDISRELRWVMENAGQPSPTVSSIRRWSWRELIAWGVAATAIIAWLGGFRTRPSMRASPIRFQITAPQGVTLPFGTLSPDGGQLAITDENGGQVWLRDLNSLTMRPLPEVNTAGPVFWSPDSRYVAFFSEGKLRKMSITGSSPPETICEVLAGYIAAGSWNSRGVILFSVGESPGKEGIYTVPEQGGSPTRLSLHDESGAELLGYWPQFLPDDQHFLFVGGHVYGQSKPGSGGNLEQVEQRSIYIANLASGKSIELVPSDYRAEYTEPGYLLFAKEGTLLAQPFDLKRFKLTGSAVPIAERVRYHQPLGYAVFSSSQSGALAYRTGGPSVQLAWYDRTGKDLGNAGDPGEYDPSFRLSPDGKRVAAGATDATSGALTADIWIIDSARKTRLRFTSDSGDEFGPVWSPDGHSVVFSAAWKAVPHLYLQRLGGAAEILLPATGKVQTATDWSRDGRWVFFEQREPGRAFDIWALPVFGERKPVRITHTPFNELDARISPDGRWLAYQSDESGRPEIYLQAFGRSGEKTLVSSSGGSQPRWRADGKELFYVANEGKVMGVAVQTGPNLTLGYPRPLFLPKTSLLGFDVSPDGQRFLISSSTGSPAQTNILLNWPSSVR